MSLFVLGGLTVYEKPFKTIDRQSYKIRFTPRKITSVWSAVNVKKVKALIQLGKMKPAGMQVFNNRTNAQGYSSEQRNVQLAREYEEQIGANQPAWLFFRAPLKILLFRASSI